MFHAGIFCLSLIATLALLLAPRGFLSLRLRGKADQGSSISLKPTLWVSLGVLFAGVCGLLVWLTPGWLGEAICLLGIASGLLPLLRAARRLHFWVAALPLVAWAFVYFSSAVIPPATLPDGPYVSKEWNLAAKAQYMVEDLPCDNVLPYLAAEFFVKKISFVQNSPILPNQPVTSRGVLTSLVAAPALSVFASSGNSRYSQERIPMLKYFGTWPNTFLLYSDLGYSSFLGSYFALLVFLMLGVFSANFSGEHYGKALEAGLIFFSSSYFLTQASFTWPKLAVGLVLGVMLPALIEEKDWRNLGVLSLLALIAAQIHPVGYYLLVILAVWCFCMLFMRGRQLLEYLKSLPQAPFEIGLLASAAILLAALAWYLRFTPIEGNMYSQNNAAHLALHDWLAVRFKTVLAYLPFPLEVGVLKSSWFTLLTIFVLPSLALLLECPRRFLVLNLVMLISFSAVALPFNFTCPIAVVGFQYALPSGLVLLSKWLDAKKVALVFAIQYALYFWTVDTLYIQSRLTLTSAVVWLSFPMLLFALYLWAAATRVREGNLKG